MKAYSLWDLLASNKIKKSYHQEILINSTTVHTGNCNILKLGTLKVENNSYPF